MKKVKRPLAVIGFTVFITGSIILSLPKEYSLILLALFALFTVFHYFTVKSYTRYLVTILLSAVFAVAYTFSYSAIFHQKIDSIPLDSQIYTGYVSAITNNDGTGYTVMLLDENNREKYAVSLYYGSGFDIADTVIIDGKFSENKNNQYVFSNYSKNILGKLTAKSVELTDINVNTVKYKALSVRKKLLDKAAELYTGDYLALVSSMGFSDKHLIPDSINDSFKSAGIAHAMVVSGFHVGIIVYLLTIIMRLLPVNKKLKNVVTAAIIVLFMYVIGLTPSIIRAGVLAAVIILASSFRIEQDSLTTLAAIGLFCIIQNPYITRDIGAMLSYLAAAGLIVANSYCAKKKTDGVRKTLFCAVAAVVFTLPVLALAGMYVTLLSPIFNLLLMLPISVICVLSVVTPVLEFLPVVNVINDVLVVTNIGVQKILLAVLKLIDKYFEFALINLGGEIIITVIICTLIAAAVAFCQTKNRKVRKIFVVTVSIVTVICYNLLNYNVVTVTAFDSGREASFHISARGKEYLVLSEWMTRQDVLSQLVSANGTKFEAIYYCPKEFKNYADYSDISEQVTEVSESGICTNETFTLKSEISKSNKLFDISVNGCDILFGHGKVSASGVEYYFLGNDKPKSISAQSIYIFGNIPSWMDVEDIIPISSDLRIKINVKTGKYKTVKDVFNFGY